jgi:hypothetical protein
MDNSIDSFKSYYSAGFSTPTKYKVLTKPPGEGWSEAEWFPESITLPSRGFQVYTDTIYGTHKQFPYKQQYNDEVVMTLNLSSQNFEREYFERWMDNVVYFNNTANLNMINIREWSVGIITEGPSGGGNGSFGLFGAYPSSIIPSNYGYGMQNEVAKLQVTFNYYKYYYWA